MPCLVCCTIYSNILLCLHIDRGCAPMSEEVLTRLKCISFPFPLPLHLLGLKPSGAFLKGLWVLLQGQQRERPIGDPVLSLGRGNPEIYPSSTSGEAFHTHTHTTHACTCTHTHACTHTLLTHTWCCLFWDSLSTLSARWLNEIQVAAEGEDGVGRW